MTHAVDVGRAEVERLAAPERARDRRPAECQPILGHLAVHHGDGATGEVVVVKAGVVVVHPADQPDRDVVVAAQLFVVALVRCVAHEVLPHLRVCRQIADERLQGGAVELVHTQCSGLVTKMACCAAAAERRESHRRDHRPVRAVEQPVDADHAQHRVDRERTVGGRVEVRQRIVHRAGRAAARGQPLGVQRREPGQHREHHAQPRVRRPPPLRPRVPGGGHLRDIGGQRRKPRGRAGRGAGMDEERRVARRKPLERGPESSRAPLARRGRPPAPTRRRRPRPGARPLAPAPGRRARALPTARTARPVRARRCGSRRAAPRPPAATRCPAGSTARSGRAADRRRRPAPPARPGHARAGRRRRRRVAREFERPARRRGAATGEGPCAAPGRRAGHPARGAGGCRRGAR